MKTPEWDLDTGKGREAMYLWLEFMLEEDMLRSAQERTVTWVNNPELWESLRPKSLSDKVQDGSASAEERQRFFQELSNPPKKMRGRPIDREARIRRNPELYLAEIVVPKIYDLWDEHYQESVYGYREYAIEFAIRWYWGDEDMISSGVQFNELFEVVKEHLRRGNRKLTVRPNKQPT